MSTVLRTFVERLVLNLMDDVPSNYGFGHKNVNAKYMHIILFIPM